MTRAALTREVTVDEARRDFESLIAAIKQENSEIILTDSGTPIARIIPADECMAARREFFEKAAAIREGFKDLSSRDLDALIDDAVAKVRAEKKTGRPSSA